MSRGRLLQAAILALGEAVASGHSLAAPARRYLADHINERTREGPGFLSLYRGTAAALDGLA